MMISEEEYSKLLDTALERVRRREKWDRRFMDVASLVALWSKDSTRVGAVLVGPENEIRLTSFNGPPKGVKDTPDRFERPAKYLYASHAEANLVAFAAREGIRTKDCTAYVTHPPCAACARTLIQAGVKRIVYGAGKFTRSATWTEEVAAAGAMCHEAGVSIEALP